MSAQCQVASSDPTLRVRCGNIRFLLWRGYNKEFEKTADLSSVTGYSLILHPLTSELETKADIRR